MQTRCINIGNTTVNAIATLNSTYILNQAEPLMCVAVMKDEPIPAEYNVNRGNKHIYSNFNVLVIRGTEHDEQRYAEWTDLIHRELFHSTLPKRNC